MKKIYILLFTLTACSKQIDQQLASGDPDITHLQVILQPVASSLLQHKENLPEFNDGYITRDELKTLAPKMGLKVDEAVRWFKEMSDLAGKLKAKYHHASEIKLYHGDNIAAVPNALQECYDKAMFTFLEGLVSCGIPTAVVGAVVAPAAVIVYGFCGTVALFHYAWNMDKCVNEYNNGISNVSN